MRAWVLGDPGQLRLVDKSIPMPGRAEVLVRIDAVGICATDLEIIDHGAPAMIGGGEPFNKMFTPGHEYMGTVVALGPGAGEYRIGQRVTVEVHAGCGQCTRCREGLYTACLNYGLNYGDVDKGHRANGFTTDGGFAEYAVNNINTLVASPAGGSVSIRTHGSPFRIPAGAHLSSLRGSRCSLTTWAVSGGSAGS
jgi:L-iditol 2-dehydrogenase